MTSLVTLVLITCSLSDARGNNEDARVRGGSVYHQDHIPGTKNANDDKAWILPLYIRKAEGSVFAPFGCAANVVTPKHLLTAAHCVCNGKALEDYEVGWPEKTGKRERKRRIKLADIVCHPTWMRGKEPKTDLAILELSEALSESVVKPIRIAADELVTDDMKFSILGWGYFNKQGKLSDRLLVANVSLIDPHECRTAFKPTKLEHVFCSGYIENLGTCPGDSGGPLVMDKTGFEEDLLFGVVRSGGKYKLCGQKEKGAEKKPTVFTDLREYTNWIYANIGQPVGTSTVVTDQPDTDEEVSTVEE